VKLHKKHVVKLRTVSQELRPWQHLSAKRTNWVVRKADKRKLLLGDYLQMKGMPTRTMLLLMSMNAPPQRMHPPLGFLGILSKISMPLAEYS